MKRNVKRKPGMNAARAKLFKAFANAVFQATLLEIQRLLADRANELNNRAERDRLRATMTPFHPAHAHAAVREATLSSLLKQI